MALVMGKLLLSMACPPQPLIEAARAVRPKDVRIKMTISAKMNFFIFLPFQITEDELYYTNSNPIFFNKLG
jgi:hypothetical protein